MQHSEAGFDRHQQRDAALGRVFDVPRRAFDHGGARERADDGRRAELLDGERSIEGVAIARPDFERVKDPAVQIVPVGESRRAPCVSGRIVLQNGRSPLRLSVGSVAQAEPLAGTGWFACVSCHRNWSFDL
jgi:hypothetical protein